MRQNTEAFVVKNCKTWPGRINDLRFARVTTSIFTAAPDRRTNHRRSAIVLE